LDRRIAALSAGKFECVPRQTVATSRERTEGFDDLETKYSSPGFFCGLDVIGLYLLANRAVYFPVVLFGASMGQVFYQKAATEIKSDTLEPFVTRLVRSQIAFGAPVLIFFRFRGPAPI